MGCPQGVEYPVGPVPLGALRFLVSQHRGGPGRSMPEGGIFRVASRGQHHPIERCSSWCPRKKGPKLLPEPSCLQRHTHPGAERARRAGPQWVLGLVPFHWGPQLANPLLGGLNCPEGVCGGAPRLAPVRPPPLHGPQMTTLPLLVGGGAASPACSVCLCAPLRWAPHLGQLEGAPFLWKLPSPVRMFS